MGKGLIILARGGGLALAVAEAASALERGSGRRERAQNGSVNSVHRLVPSYLILLMFTSFSLYEANKGWSKYPVNTNEANSRLETEQLVQGLTLTLGRNPTRISITQLSSQN